MSAFGQINLNARYTSLITFSELGDGDTEVQKEIACSRKKKI